MTYRVLYNTRTKVEIATIVIHFWFVWSWKCTKYVSPHKNIHWKAFSYLRIICAIFSICFNTRDPFNGQPYLQLVYVLLYLFGYTLLTHAMLATLRNETKWNIYIGKVGRAAKTRALHCLPFPLLLAAMIMKILEGPDVQRKIAALLEVAAVGVPIIAIIYIGIACIVRLNHKSRTSRTEVELGSLLGSMPFAIVVLAIRESRYLNVDVIFYPSLGLYVGCGIFMEFMVVYINFGASYTVLQEMADQNRCTEDTSTASPAPVTEQGGRHISTISSVHRPQGRGHLAREAEMDYYGRAGRGDEEASQLPIASTPILAPIKPTPPEAQPSTTKAPFVSAAVGSRLLEAEIKQMNSPTIIHADCTSDESLFRNACTGAEDFMAMLDTATDSSGIISNSAVCNYASKHISESQYMSVPPLEWWGGFVREDLMNKSREKRVRAVYEVFMEMQYGPPETRKKYLEEALRRRKDMTEYKGLVDWSQAETSRRGKEIDDQIERKRVLRGW